jgi:predicted aspartyl protease
LPAQLLTPFERACVILSLLLCGLMPLCAASPDDNVASVDGPDAELKEFRFDSLQTKLRAMQPGAEHDYFAGVMANRTGHVEDSIRLLTNALPSIRESQPERAAVALEALADDYTKTFHYSDAARAYDDLLAHFSSYIAPKDDSSVVHVLQGAPAQTITWSGPVHLETGRNPIGILDAELTVNGVRERWVLDTGASMSVVSRSFAQRLGLKPQPGSAQMGSGITGIQNPIQVALLPSLQMGGATLRNVVVMIFDDANLKIGPGNHAYQINGIVGFPVLRALGAITFRHDGEFEADDTAQRSVTGARMYLKLLKPIVECGVEGKELPFSFDTGASSTDLSVRYYDQFRGESVSWKKGEDTSVEAGGAVRRKRYWQPKVNLTVGDKTVTLKRVSIFPVRMGASIDEFYGNLGQDFVAGFESFTLDFANMTFRLGTPLGPDQ